MTHHQPQTPLYPLRFEPIYQYRLWGGGVWPTCSQCLSRETVLLVKHGYSATAMTIRATLPMDRLKGGASVN